MTGDSTLVLPVRQRGCASSPEGSHSLKESLDSPSVQALLWGLNLLAPGLVCQPPAHRCLGEKPLDHLAINANVMPVINFSCCLRTQCASIPGIEYAGNSDYWCAHSGTGLGRFHFKSGSCYFLAHTLWGATCPSRALAASAVQWGEY